MIPLPAGGLLLLQRFELGRKRIQQLPEALLLASKLEIPLGNGLCLLAQRNRFCRERGDLPLRLLLRKGNGEPGFELLHLPACCFESGGEPGVLFCELFAAAGQGFPVAAGGAVQLAGIEEGRDGSSQNLLLAL